MNTKQKYKNTKRQGRNGRVGAWQVKWNHSDPAILLVGFGYLLLERILPTLKVMRVSDIRSRFLSPISTSYKMRFLNTVIPVTACSQQPSARCWVSCFLHDFFWKWECMLLGAQGKKEACGFFLIKLRLMENRSLIFTIVLVKQMQVYLASYKPCYSLANNSYYCLGSHGMCCCCWPVMGAKKFRWQTGSCDITLNRGRLLQRN